MPDERSRFGTHSRRARNRRVHASQRRASQSRRRRPRRAQHVRRAPERHRTHVRHAGPLAPLQAPQSRSPDRRRRLHGPEGPRRHPQTRPLGRRRLWHAHHRRAAAAARQSPRHQKTANQNHARADRLSQRPAGRPRPPRLRLGVDLHGLQQHLHVLHRAVGPRPRTRQARNRRARRNPLRRRRRSQGNHPARPERQLLRILGRRPVRVLPTAARLRPHRRPGTRALHVPASGRLHRRRHRNHGANAEYHAPAAHAAAVRLRQNPARHAPLIPHETLPSHPRQSARRHAGRPHQHRHHRRFPRGNGRGLPTDRRHRQTRALHIRIHLRILAAPGHPSRFHATGPARHRLRPVQPAADHAGTHHQGRDGQASRHHGGNDDRRRTRTQRPGHTPRHRPRKRRPARPRRHP